MKVYEYQQMMWYKLPLKKKYDVILFLKVSEKLTSFLMCLHFLEKVLANVKCDLHVCIVEYGSEPIHEKYVNSFCHDSYSYVFHTSEMSLTDICQSFDICAQSQIMQDTSCLLVNLCASDIDSFVSSKDIDTKQKYYFTRDCQQVPLNEVEKVRSNLYSQRTDVKPYVKTVSRSQETLIDCCWASRSLENVNASQTVLSENIVTIQFLDTNFEKIQPKPVVDGPIVDITTVTIPQKESIFVPKIETLQIVDCPTCYVIHLSHRKDRKKVFQSSQYSFVYEFFNAVDKRPQGSRGRLESWRQLLVKYDPSLLWVSEDDVQYHLDESNFVEFMNTLQLFANSPYEIWIVQGQYLPASMKDSKLKKVESATKITSCIIKSSSKLKVVDILDKYQNVNQIVEFCNTCSTGRLFASERSSFSDIQNKVVKY